MQWLSKKKNHGERIRTLSMGGVLDEQTFWQIVRTEKERADRSGMPVTVAIFTIQEDAQKHHPMSGWNAATLCSALRSTARLTDHVGIAGENELGVVLWGTRELGAFRFVNRLGEKADRLASDCKLFVYPTLADDEPGEDEDKSDSPVLDEADPCRSTDDPFAGPNDILDRIADVEHKLAQAQAVETPVVQDEDCQTIGEYFSYGANEQDVPATICDQAENLLGTATGVATLVRKAAAPSVDDVMTQAGLSATTSIDRSAARQKERIAERQTGLEMNVEMEPLENLFVLPHPLWKRSLDVVGSLFGIVLLSPVLMATTLVIKLTSPGPVLFRQIREGHGGKLFTILKFRTMRVGADAEKAQLQAENEQHGPAFKMEHDPRITPIGSFLRKTCLDELPQLWNVLKGDMTLVGPRPLDHRESSQIARWGRRRLHVMPGLTCIWQVHGKSKVTFNEWMRMDIRYSQKVTFWQDIKLVFATLKQVVLRQASH